MKIESVSGCTFSGVYVDNKSLYNIAPEKQREILDKLLLKATDSDIVGILEIAVENIGEYYSDEEPCDQCGDTYESYTVMLD